MGAFQMSLSQCNGLRGQLVGEACYPLYDVFLMSVILMVGTFTLATVLKHFRNTNYLSNKLRATFSDFAVMLAIVLMTALDYFAAIPTPKLHITSSIKARCQINSSFNPAQKQKAYTNCNTTNDLRYVHNRALTELIFNLLMWFSADVAWSELDHSTLSRAEPIVDDSSVDLAGRFALHPDIRDTTNNHCYCMSEGAQVEEGRRLSLGLARFSGLHFLLCCIFSAQSQFVQNYTSRWAKFWHILIVYLIAYLSGDSSACWICGPADIYRVDNSLFDPRELPSNRVSGQSARRNRAIYGHEVPRYFHFFSLATLQNNNCTVR